MRAAMILRIDTDAAVVEVEEEHGMRAVPFNDPEAFALVSKAWLRAGWDVKYVYRFTWLGRPIIQLPEDIVRLQEMVFRVQPDVIVETGIAHGGSLVLFASLCEAMGHGSVVGVDIDIRPHNREAIESHTLFPRITLVEGDSTDTGTFAQVLEAVGAAETRPRRARQQSLEGARAGRAAALQLARLRRLLYRRRRFDHAGVRRSASVNAGLGMGQPAECCGRIPRRE